MASASAPVGLNYHHLAYFHAVAREGGVHAAARRLGVGAPAVSAQVAQLEASLRVSLFERRKRRLELTEAGRLALSYADSIFATGRELVGALRQGHGGAGIVLRVGLPDILAKTLAFSLLEPAFESLPDLRLSVREGPPDELFAALAVHELDLVLSDVPLRPGLDVRAFNHLLGECGTTLFAAPALHEALARGLPRSLDGAPFLMPAPASAIRRSLDGWFSQRGLTPRVVGEFADSALIKVFGAAGRGMFAAPTAVEAVVANQHGVRALARLPDVAERFYAISAERRLQHPAAVAITRAARDHLFEASEDEHAPVRL